MRNKKLTPRAVLIKLAGRRFATWNFDALRLEAGTPGPTDETTLKSLPEGARLWHEPITAHDAAEYVIAVFMAQTGGPYKLIGLDGQRLMDRAVEYYSDTTDLALERLLKDIHAEGMQALDRMIATDQEFLHTMLLLGALGAADRVWAMNQNTSYAQDLRQRPVNEITADVEQAGHWDLIAWEVDVDGYYPSVTDAWADAEERLNARGGALQRLPRDLWPSLDDDK